MSAAVEHAPALDSYFLVGTDEYGDPIFHPSPTPNGEDHGAVEYVRAASGHTSLAIIAAQAASEGAGEMLRFAREGAAGPRFPFEWDPVEKLVEAGQRSAEIERDYADQVTDDARDVEGLRKLGDFIGACTLFLEGWA